MPHNILITVNLFTINVSLVDFDSECDVFYNNSCFKHIKDPTLSWDKSNQACDDIGGYLTSIHSENENEMLANLVKISNNNHLNTYSWIGLDAERYNDASTWVDGSPVTYINTTLNYQKSTCIIIISSRSWTRDSCSKKRQYICRKTGKLINYTLYNTTVIL